MQCIAQKYLNQLQQRVKANGMQLLLPAELAEQLGAAGIQKGGARDLRRLVQQRVETPLAEFLLTGEKKPTKIQAELDGQQLCFRGLEYKNAKI